MITKNTLKAEDVRQMSEAMLRDTLGIVVQGYTCTSEQVGNVLLKAAVEGMRVESICGDMQMNVDSNASREQLKRVLDVCELRRQECDMKRALVECVPKALPRRGREMALDYPDEPFYGQTGELLRYAVRGQAKEGTPHVYRIASLYVIWRQVRVTLALTYGLPEDGTAQVVQRLLERLQQVGFQPGVV